MGGYIANHAGQVFLKLPTHMVGQPIDLSRQLHIALNPHRRLVAAHHLLQQGQRRGLGQDETQVGAGAGRRQIQQSGWCRYQRDS
jgi:hypothetical protein